MAIYKVELRVYDKESGEITAVNMPKDYDPAFTSGHLFRRMCL